MKQIIGQQGDKSCAHNLYIWLRDWHKNRQDPKNSSTSTFILCSFILIYIYKYTENKIKLLI